MRDNDNIIIPNRDVWPFISKVFWKWMDHPESEGPYLCEKNFIDSIFDDKWFILGISIDSVILRLMSEGDDNMFWNCNFQITKIQTKGGVILENPNDIISYFIPSFNLMLEEERLMRCMNSISYR